MKVLSSRIISTVRSGTYQYAVVENLTNGKATVNLGKSGTGARLTNLNVAGAIDIGEMVYVDYSTDVPYVRAVQHIVEEEEEIEEALPDAETPHTPCGGY